MALPAGVPEVIQVVCNNYFGHFVVRSKTVVDRQWQEHPVAKFASLCGKSHLAWRHNTSVAAVGVSYTRAQGSGNTALVKFTTSQ
jgi:hypothetical protein